MRRGEGGSQRPPLPQPSRDRPPVELWYADLSAIGRDLRTVEQDDPLLSEDERALFADALRGPGAISPMARDETRLLARLSLRLLIERVFGPQFRAQPFRHGPHGKPFLPGLPGDFSLSHTTGHALVALGGAPALGVDLETARPIHMAPSRRDRIADAAIRIAAGAALPPEPDARTLQAWARLEAFAKADGGGIGRTLTRLGAWGRTGAKGEAGTSSDTEGAFRIAEDAAKSEAASGPQVVVADVVLGPGFHAALARPQGHIAPPVWRMPSGATALAALRAGAPVPSGAPLKFSR